MSMENTFIVIKPDAVAAKKVGAILSRFENAGLSIEFLESVYFDVDMVRKLYGQHQGKDFYADNMAFIMSGICIIGVIRGNDAVAKVRTLVGKLGDCGTIRGDFGTQNPRNACHASDSSEAAFQEIRAFV